MAAPIDSTSPFVLAVQCQSQMVYNTGENFYDTIRCNLHIRTGHIIRIYENIKTRMQIYRPMQTHS